MAKRKKANSKTVKQDSPEAKRIETTHRFGEMAARRKAKNGRSEKSTATGGDSK